LLPASTPPSAQEEEDARPEAFDEITNGLPGKKLRSDDPNFKSQEQIRWAGRPCWLGG
jgi:hypothetical protein